MGIIVPYLDNNANVIRNASKLFIVNTKVNLTYMEFSCEFIGEFYLRLLK